MKAQMTFTANDEEAFSRRRDELVSDFGTWLRETSDRTDASDLNLLLDWKWGYGDGHLDRWGRDDLSEFLLGWCPRKLSAPADLVSEMPGNVGGAMQFLAERGLWSARNPPAPILVAHAESLQEEFLAQMDNPANFGMAKSLFTSAGIDEPESLTPESLQGVMDEFNARPEAERRAITDPALAGSMPALPDLGLVELPEADEVGASAEQSPMLAAFDTLADYFAAPGKPLTKTGAIKIADAVALAERLGTGETMEEHIGDEVFRKRSSRDFTQVDLWLWLARECGVLREQRGKLVGVKAWQQRRRADPSEEIARGFQLIVGSGVLQATHPHFYFPFHETLDLSVIPMLAVLVQHRQQEFEELVDRAVALLAAQHLEEPYSGATRRALDEIVRLLEWSGVISQHGAREESDGLWTAQRHGGTVRLTPVGMAVTVRLLQEWEFGLSVAPPVAERTAAQLVDLAGAVETPQLWWESAVHWLDVQPDLASAVRELLDAFADANLAALIIALSAMPESGHDRLSVVLRELAAETDPSEESRLAALTWLVDHELVDPNEVDPGSLTAMTLMTMGAFAELDGGETMVASFAEDFDQAKQLELIALTGRLLPPRAVNLLTALGEHHPDKHLAKAARKELFRVRSKLTSMGRAH